MKTLVLYANYSSTASYYDDWHDSFLGDNDLECESLDICTIDIVSFRTKIREYEFIVLLHSTNADRLIYLNNLMDCLNERKGVLSIFVGNEVNIIGTSMSKRISLLDKLNADFIFTQLLEETGKWLYSSCIKSTIISIPHALNSKSFFPLTSVENRKTDIGVRSFKYSSHLGDNERTIFFEKMQTKLKEKTLSSDISFDPNQRFTREQWSQFLQSCKGTIATEAGTYYLQKDDQLVQEIQNYLESFRKKNGGITLSDTSILSRTYLLLPKRLKEYVKYLYYKYSDMLNIKHEHMLSEEVNFKDIYDSVIYNYDMCEFYSKAISSRHFDAIGTKTVLLMLEGRYNDILIPDKHYIAIKKDYSNLDESIERLRDDSYIKEMSEVTWHYVMQFHQHQNRIKKIKELF